MCSANVRGPPCRFATIGAALVMAAQLIVPGPARAGLCAAAAAAAEQAASLPSGLLAAIGRVESGGRGSTADTDQGWPWTVDSLGQGRRFPTKAEAVAHVQGLLLSGIRSIDVGCFQVNLQWHPAAFASLEEAFDPGVNARYAASFLVSLRGDEPGWSGAIARYHSRTGSLGLPYGAAVAAAWRGGAVGLGYPAGVLATPLLPLIHVWYGAIAMPPADRAGQRR